MKKEEKDKVSRRRFLKQLGVVAGGLPATALLQGACGGGVIEDEESREALTAEYNYEGSTGPEALFSHGVASGDPLPDAVILWTRVSPEASPEPVEVFWEVALEDTFINVVRSGVFTTAPSRDYTVKVDVNRLEAGQTYYYRFRAQDRTSVVGRTKTAALQAERVRCGVVSCSSYGSGYFNVYKSVAEQDDLDVVLHLGDYIYEYGQTGTLFADGAQISAGALASRVLEPLNEIVTLKDYRTRYSLYRRDPDLQAVHQMHPFICVWDDHETANNSWRNGAGNHSEETEGSWELRRWAAIKAYFEWLPIRESAQAQRIWRRFKFGDLVDLVMLDTRQWGREEQPELSSTIDGEDRQLLGQEQEAWLTQTFQESTAVWRLIGQQVMMGQLQISGPINPDQWDGYPEARTKFFDLVESEAGGNVVVLTGDIHTSWANELTRTPQDKATYDPMTSEGTIAVEFVTPSVTSPGLSQVSPGILRILERFNPHIKYVDLVNRGYLVVDVTKERVQGAWYHVDTITSRDFKATFSKAFHVKANQPRLVEDDAPA